jgi:hypothetical protein
MDNNIKNNVNSTSSSGDNIFVSGTVKVSLYDIDDIHKCISNWDTLSESEKITQLKTDSITEFNSLITRNITTVKLHKYLSRNLNQNLNNPEDNLEVTHFGIGDDASSGTASSDTNLNNLLLSKTISDSLSENGILKITGLIGASELNGKTINEIGVATADLSTLDTSVENILLNHATFTDIEKDSTSAITFTIELEFTNT